MGRFFIIKEGESMTENQIPVENTETDTSSVEPAQNEESAVTSEQQTEPVSDIDTADVTEKENDDEPKAQEKLYAGKYKSLEELEKGYLEAQKFVGKAGELEKQLAAYKEQEDKARELREMQAKAQGFTDIEEQNIAAQVAVHEFNLFAEALEAGYAKEHYNEAYQALLKYQQTGNPNDLAIAKRLFAPEALEFIAENRKAFKDQKLTEYQTTKQQTLFQTAKQNLENFVKETGDWINPKERQDVIGALFGEFGGNFDFTRTKEMIDKIEQGAIERYKQSLKAEQEQQDRFDQMQTPTGVQGTIRADKWFTKDQVDKMSETEYIRNADKIVRQMQMEKDGLLLQTLTK